MKRSTISLRAWDAIAIWRVMATAPMRQSQHPGLDMIDEIRIGTDFFSVAAAVPESSSVVFAGGAALVVTFGRLWRRKRRRAV